jgi:outer membrane immunogenic protein
MRKLLLASTAVAMLSGVGGAFAADLPTRKGPPMAPVYIPPAFSWTGFYVGVNAGYGWLNTNNNNNNFGGFPFFGAVPVAGGFVPIATSGNNGNGGFVGGIQGGYNYQFTPGAGFVLGIEADIDYADLGRKTNSVVVGSFTLPQFPGTVFTPSNLLGASRSNNNQYIGTVRLRAGYAWDRFLVYGTGGLAYGGIRNNGNGFGGGFTATTAAGFVNPVSGAAGPSTAFLGAATTGNSSTRTGWTLGVGGEYAFTNNWTVKAEYLYMNFGSGNNAPGIFLPGAAAVLNNNKSRDVNIVRVGLNYKFW